jgi:intermembrane space import and assembly protein 40
MPDGRINWNCPCLGGMANGPCGPQFREAFSCFHYSEADPKGSDCYESFKRMQECMQGYPDLYPTAKLDDEPSAEGQSSEGASNTDTAAEGVSSSSS